MLAASLAQALLFEGGDWVLSWRNPALRATVPAALVAWRTRSVLLTMLARTVSYAALRRLLL